MICLRSSAGQEAGKLAPPVAGGSVAVADAVAVDVLDDVLVVDAEAVGTEPLVLLMAPMKAFPAGWEV